MKSQSFATFIISLKNSGRCKILTNQLNEKGIKYRLIEAIDGKNLNLVDIKNNFNESASIARLGYKMSPTLIACALSHRSTYKYFLSLNTRWALIFEEDATLNNNFDQKVLDKCLKMMPNEPVILQLFSRSSRLASRKKFKLIDKIDKGVFVFKFSPRLPGFGAAAYLINREAAKLATTGEKLIGPPDFPNWHSNVNFYGLYPWVCHESAKNSTIEENSMRRGIIWLRRLLIFTGFHYLKYRKEYFGLRAYLKEEFIPMIYFFIWKLKGSRFFTDKESPQII